MNTIRSVRARLGVSSGKMAFITTTNSPTFTTATRFCLPLRNSSSSQCVRKRSPFSSPRHVFRHHPVIMAKSTRDSSDTDAATDGDKEKRGFASANDALLRDAAKFRSKRGGKMKSKRSASNRSDNDADDAKSNDTQSANKAGLVVRRIVDTVLIWDFFLVIALLLCLGIAIVPHFATHDDRLLNLWLSLWQPFIQPVLNVLMLGALAQGALNFIVPKPKQKQ